MKFRDVGAFFIKRKDGEVWRCIYYKTNHLKKMHPEAKLTSFDMKTKEFKTKSYSPNKIFGAFFDKNGRDYVMQDNVSAKEMKKMIMLDSEEVYDFNDFSSAVELYEKMKESGLKKFYTKKWFEKEYKFTEGQIDMSLKRT
jgi:hypothetical protein